MDLEFGGKRAKPDVRRLFDMREVVYDKAWLSGTQNAELYFMYRDLSLAEQDAAVLKGAGVRYDITIIPPRMLGCEFTKTAGHYHPIVPGTDPAGVGVTYPEIYQVLEGEAHYLMQKVENQIVKDVFLVKASQGDVALIPPGYGHITVNAASETLKMANFVARDFQSDYSPIREKGGGAYFLLQKPGKKTGKTGALFVKNQAYGRVPELRQTRPTDPRAIGLKKGEKMYELVHDIEKLEFLTKPQEHAQLFEKTYE